MNQWSIAGLGMGTVFLALIGLALIVALFPLLFRKAARKRAHPAPLPMMHEPTAAAPAPALGAETVAVIAAAIAAASGMAPGAFRIASIAAVGGNGQFNTPAWGHVDRFARPAEHR